MTDERSRNPRIDCLSDETMTLWVEGLLSPRERASLEEHTKGCAACRDLLQTLSDIRSNEEKEVLTPRPLVLSARQIIKQTWENQIAVILLKISKGVYSAAQTTGRILFAPWLEPGLAFRSDGNANPSSVVIETVYRHMRCVVESSRTQDGGHALIAVFTAVETSEPIEPALFVLYEDNEEIESQMSLQGKVAFEDLPPGAYRLTMTLPDGSQGHLDFHLIAS